MAISNTTTLNDLIGTIVSDEAQSAAYGARVMRDLIVAKEIPAGAGSITIPRFQALTVGALTEGTAPSSTTWSTDGVLITPVERGVYVQVSKKALYADPFSDLTPYGEQMGRALGQDEDEQILALASGLSTNQIASGANVSGFLGAIAKLENGNAPGPYFAVFHPQAWASIRAELDDASAYASVGKDIVEGFGEGFTNVNGFVGAPYGVPCFVSSKVQKDAGGTTAYNVMFSKQAFGFGYMQDITIDVDNNVTARAFDLMGWYSAKAEKLVDVYAVRITSTVS